MKEKRTTGRHELDATSALAHKVEVLTRKLESLTMGLNKALAMIDANMVGSSEIDQMEQVNYMGNPIRPRNDPFSNTYNPGWRNHPNFRCNSNTGQGNNMQPPGFSRPAPPPHVKPSSLEEMLTQYIKASENQHQATEAALRNQGASIHNLENQLGQISKMLSERTPRSLPGNIETNPQEHVKAVTLMSGKELQF